MQQPHENSTTPNLAPPALGGGAGSTQHREMTAFSRGGERAFFSGRGSGHKPEIGGGCEDSARGVSEAEKSGPRSGACVQSCRRIGPRVAVVRKTFLDAAAAAASRVGAWRGVGSMEAAAELREESTPGGY